MTLQSALQPLRLPWGRPPPDPATQGKKTIALIDIQIPRSPGLPSIHPGACHRAEKGFGVCSVVVQGWSWGIVFIKCDKGSLTNGGLADLVL